MTSFSPDSSYLYMYTPDIPHFVPPVHSVQVNSSEELDFFLKDTIRQEF